MARRKFLELSALGTSAVGTGAIEAQTNPKESTPSAASEPRKARTESGAPKRHYTGVYEREYLNRVAFPLGGIGAGMLCLEGTGALSHFSLRNRPEVFNEPCVFAAIGVRGSAKLARVLEGPVPGWKLLR